MNVNKISFHGMRTKSNIKTQEPKDFSKNSTSPDKEKSNAAKYMIGATALAGVIILGVVGHKNNWWKVAKNSSIEGNVNSVLTRKVEMFYKADGKTPDYEILYDVPTGNPLKIKLFDDSGKNIKTLEEYDVQSGNLFKSTEFKLGTNKKDSVMEYDPVTLSRVKYTSYKYDGETISCIKEYDKSTDNLVKVTYYKSDGKTPLHIVQYDSKTGKELKTISNLDETVETNKSEKK